MILIFLDIITKLEVDFTITQHIIIYKLNKCSSDYIYEYIGSI